MSKNLKGEIFDELSQMFWFTEKNHSAISNSVIPTSKLKFNARGLKLKNKPKFTTYYPMI